MLRREHAVPLLSDGGGASSGVGSSHAQPVVVHCGGECVAASESGSNSDIFVLVGDGLRSQLTAFLETNADDLESEKVLVH